MSRFSNKLFFIFLLTWVCLLINLPNPLNFNLFNQSISLKTRPDFIQKDLSLKTGLDLQGGTHLVLNTDMSQINTQDRDDALTSVKQIISQRVDLYGVTEPVIQTATVKDQYRLIIELPGIQDIDEAVNLIGQTAQLDFRSDQAEDAGTVDYASPSAFMRVFEFQSTGLTGKDLKKATVNFAQQDTATNEPVVSLQFTKEGADKFKNITESNLNRPVAIFLDDQLVTAPTVNDVIADGQAIISGGFTAESASQLSIQLNAGALPVPVEIIEQSNISATLGANSINQSIQAGLVGLAAVMLFMILLYGFNGFLASVALIIYGLITLSLYRLIPVTLTLPGIAGFVLSVGMAVDSNILIFERLKEELRAKKPYPIALELAFGRAWDSIKDANTTTIVISLILINPLNWSWLNTSGMVRGFALTLFLGVLISLFTGIVVTRTFMRQMISKHD